VPHGLGTAAPPGMASPAGAADPIGAAAPALWHASSSTHLLSRGHNFDERDRPRKRRFGLMDEVRITWINGSTCPADQRPQPSFQGNPRRP
jgi:hypothetical protein